MISIGFLEHFQTLEDPRQLKRVLYPLNEILLMFLCGVICGSETWVDILEYGEEKLDGSVANLGKGQIFLIPSEVQEA